MMSPALQLITSVQKILRILDKSRLTTIHTKWNIRLKEIVLLCLGERGGKWHPRIHDRIQPTWMRA